MAREYSVQRIGEIGTPLGICECVIDTKGEVIDWPDGGFRGPSSGGWQGSAHPVAG
jgi:hypothetical protein